MGLSLLDYKNLIVQLLPRGQAWAGDNVRALVQAFAAECRRADVQIDLLFAEALPMTTSQCLADWERIAGLPDAVFGGATTDEERRNNLVAKLSAVGGQSKAYLVLVAAQMGYQVGVEDRYRPFSAGSRAGDALTNGVWAFAFTVSGSVIDARLQTMINQLKPAHAVAIFQEV